MIKRRTSILTVVAVLLTGLVCGCGPDASRDDAKRSALARATALLRSVGHSTMAKGWSAARLTGRVTPIYRPDVDGIAYYEVLVDPRGYVVVSTGQHDHPIAQWSSTGEAPTQMLRRKARRDGKQATRFYRLDALSYAAEDERGQLAAQVGQLPQRIDGRPSADAHRSDTVNTVWKPRVDSTDNVVGGAITTTLRRAGAKPEVVGLERYKAGRFETIKAFAPAMTAGEAIPWRELKASYAERFAPQLRALSERAASAWRFESRDAAAQVKPSTAGASPASKAMGLAVPITPWTFIYAEGGTPAQRGYDQIPPWVHPNYASCSSGCGATAWAMLFGWADHLAEQDSERWAGHWGIYRQNGGYGADAEAPLAQDAGVDAMTMELRARLGTFCIGNQGATMHFDMHRAAHYLAYRDHAGIRINYNLLTIADNGLLQNAIDILATKRPVIIGLGVGSSLHYALAHALGFRYHSDGTTEIAFGVNWGDGPNTTEVWIPASTWFIGELVP